MSSNCGLTALHDPDVDTNADSAIPERDRNTALDIVLQCTPC